MRLMDTVEILSETVTRDAERNEIKMWGVAATTKGDLQPYGGGERANKEYGVSETSISYRVFCRPTDITDSNRLRINGEDYTIWRISKFARHMEIIVRSVL